VRICVKALESLFIEFVGFVELKQTKKLVFISVNDLVISHWSPVTGKKTLVSTFELVLTLDFGLWTLDQILFFVFSVVNVFSFDLGLWTLN
jgi:hypothetical protein